MFGMKIISVIFCIVPLSSALIVNPGTFSNHISILQNRYKYQNLFNDGHLRKWQNFSNDKMQATPSGNNEPEQIIFPNSKRNGSTPVVRRREILKKGLSSFFLLSISVPNARAAIPTMDDYEKTTNGATLVINSKLSDSEQKIIQILAQSQPIQDQKSLILFSEKIIESLNALDPLVKEADWAAVRSVLRSEGQYEGNVLGLARKSFFGMPKGKGGGITKLQTMMGSGVDVRKIEDAREDLAFSLSQLEDFALENRSVFFNSLDKKQVEELISETGFQEKLLEGNELLNMAKSSANEFKLNISNL